MRTAVGLVFVGSVAWVLLLTSTMFSAVMSGPMFEEEVDTSNGIPGEYAERLVAAPVGEAPGGWRWETFGEGLVLVPSAWERDDEPFCDGWDTPPEGFSEFAGVRATGCGPLSGEYIVFRDDESVHVEPTAPGIKDGRPVRGDRNVLRAVTRLKDGRYGGYWWRQDELLIEVRADRRADVERVLDSFTPHRGEIVVDARGCAVIDDEMPLVTHAGSGFLPDRIVSVTACVYAEKGGISAGLDRSVPVGGGELAAATADAERCDEEKWGFVIFHVRDAKGRLSSLYLNGADCLDNGRERRRLAPALRDLIR
ncbi:hypothetical protein GCM10027589_51370 [Actinocorallia lasiicapitis]